MTVSSGSGVTMLPSGGGGAASGITIGTSVITGGTNTRVLFDDSGVIGEDAGFTYNKTTDALSVAGSVISPIFVVATAVQIANGAFLQWFTNSTKITDSNSNGDLTITNQAGNSFGLLKFGGTTSSFPALKRNGAALEHKLADDSAYSSFTATTGILNALGSDSGQTTATVCAESTTGQLFKGSGTIGICLGTSSARYKRDIAAMSGGLTDILSLKPVKFRYLKGYGDDGSRKQVGFLAEDVAETTPDIVGRDKEGRPNTVDMMALVPLLTKAIQEQQMQIDELRARMS